MRTAGRNRFIFITIFVIGIYFSSGSFLAPFADFTEYVQLSESYLKSPAINTYCKHGGRYMLWLPYRGREKNINVTYFGTEQPMKMTDAWRRTYLFTSEMPWCVIARFGI